LITSYGTAIAPLNIEGTDEKTTKLGFPNFESNSPPGKHIVKNIADFSERIFEWKGGGKDQITGGV
jgi:hypothetical protein